MRFFKHIVIFAFFKESNVYADIFELPFNANLFRYHAMVNYEKRIFRNPISTYAHRRVSPLSQEKSAMVLILSQLDATSIYG